MSDVNTSSTESAVGIQMGAALTNYQTVSNTPFLTVPEDFKVIDLEKFLPGPSRKRGNTSLRDVASFNQFVIENATPDARIYGSFIKPGFKAVFNHTTKDAAGWGDHTATFDCPLSVEWSTWKSYDGKQMTQADFAAFIENNLPDIAQPPAADMLEISRTLEAKKKVNFASGVRLANGETELTYEEQVSGTAAKGKITVPEMFTIGIPVLENGAPYAVQCRLRYRIGEGGKMAMWYELVRPHKILEDAIKEVWTTIQNTTGVTIFNGSPA